ncbi:MAG: hypothetical protein Q8K11_10680 [Phenylobacterium sp.]|uniref:hypothetical protein n=1 Tax=Phenylobacterium sp. TaxID=1871053 RepID=UPI0027314661|nr:hypothetical protein [Phenylobacterium sp.]MDP2010633.1 hypothetical protein [Phenylobacterium sp.]
MVQKLSEITRAPVIGETYLVPTIVDTWLLRWDRWPVRGKPHTEIGRGPLIDWHLDRRFLTEAQDEHAAEMEGHLAPGEIFMGPDPGAGRRWPGSRITGQHHIVWSGADRTGTGVEGFDRWLKAGVPPHPELTPLVCRHPTVAPEPMVPAWNLSEYGFGSPAHAIITNDGRPLCPHQKVDLTGEPCDRDGVVICPFHRLRVKVST